MEKSNTTPLITAGYFGKLPQHTDFIKFNSGGPEILAIDNWIQQGILSARQKMKDSWKQLYRNSPSYFFIYPFTGSENYIAGIIQPSFDKNRREYPFIAYLIIPCSFIRTDEYPKLPLLLSEHFQLMLNLSRKNLTKLNDQIASMTTGTLINEYADSISDYLSIAQMNFWKNSFNGSPRQDEFKMNLLELSKGLPLIHTIINSDESLICFDLCILTALVTGASNSEKLPALFWSTSDKACSVYHLFEPSALQYSDLFNSELNSEVQYEPHSGFPEIFNDKRSLNELIQELKKLREINA